MVRLCQSCDSEFEFEYVGRGRPRAYCIKCQPPNTRMVKAAKSLRLQLHESLAGFGVNGQLESHTGAFNQARARRRPSRITPFTGEHTDLRQPRQPLNSGLNWRR
jgi:hypothetical protein